MGVVTPEVSKCPSQFLLWVFLTLGEFNSLQPPSEGTWKAHGPTMQELIMYLPTMCNKEAGESPGKTQVTGW